MADAPPPADPGPGGSSGPQPAEGGEGETQSTPALVAQLQADRLWLLRQIDAGAWPEWRLDLAALERELGELLDRVTDQGSGAG
ncbi:MAG: hypothetical protein ACNA8O_12975 [Cyanobacteriota bacterium]